MEGLGSQTHLDFVIQFAKVVSSALIKEPNSSDNQAVAYNVAGIGGFDATSDEPILDNSDDSGEYNENTEVYGSLGVIGRPLPPETVSGRSAHAEVACLKTADGLVPIATRDLRLKMPGEGPGEGTVALIGYGGGFHSLDPVNDGDDGTIHVLYCPYSFTGGVATKAHSIILDPTAGNESIILVHGDGMAITMADDALIGKHLLLKNDSGDATIRLDSQGITMTASKIVLKGGVIIGDPVAAQPLLAGVASQPSTKLWFSP